MKAAARVAAATEAVVMAEGATAGAMEVAGMAVAMVEVARAESRTE